MNTSSGATQEPRTGTVTVVVPVFNGIEYLPATLASVRQQTHPALELIVVDDGSTDGSVDYLRSNRDLTLIQQKNAGPGPARNNGAAAAGGEWLAFLDSDDVWDPCKLEKQLAVAAETGADLVYSNVRPIGQTEGLAELQHEPGTVPTGDLLLRLLHDNFITLSSVLIRRRVFEDLGGFCADADVKGAEDWDLWLRYAATGGQVSAVDEPLVAYRWHELNLSTDVRRMHNARMAVLTRALDSPQGAALADAQRASAVRALQLCSAWFASRRGSWRAVSLYAASLRGGGSWTGAAKGIARAFLNRMSILLRGSPRF